MLVNVKQYQKLGDTGHHSYLWYLNFYRSIKFPYILNILVLICIFNKPVLFHNIGSIFKSTVCFYLRWIIKESIIIIIRHIFIFTT